MILSRYVPAVVLFCLFSTSAFCQEKEDDKEKKPPHVVTLAGEKFTLEVPGEWESKRPRVRFIQHEFKIPAAEGDKSGGRMTIMAAGGSVDANIQRWVSQFEQQGGDADKKADVKKKEIAGQTVHLVELHGTFVDRRGPYAPPTRNENHAMLAAIIETETSGKQFIKLTAPEKTAKAVRKDFQQMVSSLKAK